MTAQWPETDKRPSRWNSSRLRADRQLLTAVAGDKSVLFLDIETTGLSRYYDEVTLVGYLVDGHYDVCVRGQDPGRLLDALASADTLVTFNGTLFDVPFLLQTFEDATVPPTHIDLRYAVRRLGLSGGQKILEEELGIRLRDGFEDVSGAEAVLLWHRYLRGDMAALQLLVRYNRADVVGLCQILDHLVDQVEHRDLWIEPVRFGDVNLDQGVLPFAELSLPSPPTNRALPSFKSLFGARAASAVSVGIDLTGSEAKPSGFCVLRGAHASTSMIGPDDELVAAIEAARPEIVSIDSPLCLPKGRLHVGDDDPGRELFGIMRESERTLKRRGINVYPCLLPSMQRLTARGIALAERLRKLGYPVIESYPGAAQDIMGIPRKGAGVHWLQLGLAEFGIEGAFVRAIPSHDELDAITSALVGTFLLDGQFEGLGGEGETALIVPKLSRREAPLIIGVSGRIAAGKTTAARWIEQQGFAYTRFSLVIDDEIRAQGLAEDRPTRQRIGFEIHNERGQAWLCERVLARVGDARRIVVDGLRWPEDHGFFVERFGHNFFHVHIRAPEDARCLRAGGGSEDAAAAFREADSQPVEAMVDTLGKFAAATIDNCSTLAHFEGEVARALQMAGSERE